MAEDGGQEKSEKATAKKRRDTRREGQVAKSAEISSVAVLLVAVSVLSVFGFFFYPKLETILTQALNFQKIPEFNRQFCVSLLIKSVGSFFVLVAPVMGAAFVAAFFANYVQVGFNPTAKPLALKFSKFNIVKGFGRLLSLRSFVELFKSILKLLVIGTVAYFAVKGEMEDIATLYQNEASLIFLFILKGFLKIFTWVLVVMVVLAAADYAYQKWQFEKDMKMTKQEVKEEHKETEGNPQIKSRIRSIQMQMARKRMMRAVPDADVVVTNPTHLAVAIQYNPSKMSAPVVVAKGAGRVAVRIKEIAGDHSIPVVENKELARNLYKTVDIGETIGSEFYKAIAELLAYVYKLKKKTIG